MKITRQNVNTWTKRITREPELSGSTYLLQEKADGSVDVSASGDHQSISIRVLGPEYEQSSLSSYIVWKDVSATNIVDLLYEIDNA